MTKLISTIPLALALAGCVDAALDTTDTVESSTLHTCQPLSLRTDLVWFGENRQTLDGWIASHGCTNDDYKPHKKPIALFDWDHTVIKNDVGDAITFHAIKHDKVRQPPNQDWKQTSSYMTDAAAAALTLACGTDVPAGQPLPTSTNLECADEMLSMYIDGKTRSGAAAFAGWNFRRIEPTYAWTAQLLAGNTHEEVSQMALDAVVPKLSAPIGTTQVVGTRTLNGWVRLYEQIGDAIDVLYSHGYDVWVITASPQDVVRALSPLAGIPSDHVIGIRSLTDADGRLTYRFEGCGPVPDGESSMISYIEGKRCWVNKVVFGDNTVNAINRRPEGKRQVFGFGDSDTDIAFMRDATYKLAVNRNKRELMCYAYNNQNGAWLVNPMFITPNSAQAAPYPCSTTACKDAAGVGRPCLDENGNVIPDQIDSVHP